MKLNSIKIIPLLIIFALVLSACGTPAVEETAAPVEVVEPEATEAVVEMTEEPEAEPEIVGTIKIGAALSETGRYATVGLDVRQGYDLWVNYVNEEIGGINVDGDLYLVEIIYYDDESDADTTVKLTEKLISEDEVQFILGPYGSSLTIASSSITEQHGILMIEANGASESIFNRGFKHVFGVLSPASFYAKAVMEALADAGAKTVVVGIEDNAFSISVGEGIVFWANEYGFEILAEESYPNGETSSAVFDPIMTKFKALNPDAYINSGHLNDGIAAAASAASLGFCPGGMFFMASANFPAFAEELGDTAAYAGAATQWAATMSYDGLYLGSPGDYYDRYTSAYGMDPTYQAAESTAAGFVLQNAIEAAGSTETAAVREALLNMDITTFYGDINFDETGKNVAHAMAAGQVIDGEFQIVWPAEVAVKEFVYPNPNCGG